jgi:erythromycin esterase-like protein
VDDAADALGEFRRFPQWMWRNADVLDFVGWLREHNDTMPPRKAGFYGLDLYSLHASMQEVLRYLDRADPEAAARARERYACFEQFGDDPNSYAYAAGLGLTRTCEEEVVAQLVDLLRRRSELMARAGGDDDDLDTEQFAAEQNARVVLRAEEYYRAMFAGRVDTWNLRDTHMVDTLDQLLLRLGGGGRAKLIVWAHNSHLGDARATDMGAGGQLNVGQLVRERHPNRSLSVGLFTAQGTVSAAGDWGEPVERKTVVPARYDSYEELFSHVGLPRFYFDPRRFHGIRDQLAERRLERAIGVIYRPETERLSHYFGAQLPDQFDVLLHFDHTRAVEPLERTATWREPEPPETYPSAL